MDEPLSPSDAKRAIRRILAEGTWVILPHCRQEMDKDGLDDVDCVNVLRGGVVEPAERENDAWRYRVHTSRIWVVVEFESDLELLIVTAWRVKP